jgi:hypothetical protein
MPGFTARPGSVRLDIVCHKHHRQVGGYPGCNLAGGCVDWWYVDGYYEEYVAPREERQDDIGEDG